MSNEQVKHYQLPPLMASQGGVVFNEAHIEYWERRAHLAEINALRAVNSHDALTKALEEAKAAFLEIQSLARETNAADEDSGFNLANVILTCDTACADIDAALSQQEERK